ncbi:MAG: ABC transporter permease [bacterium]
MNALAIALRDSLRDWRLASVRLLALALIVAVMAVTTVSFFTDRVDRAMRSQATALLGADLLIQSPRPFSQELTDFIAKAYVKYTRTVSFPTVALAGDVSRLLELKAVDEGYPLRGQLEIKLSRDQPASAATGIPAPGEAWVEDRVLVEMGLQPGDSLSLGVSEFRISRIISFEPDRGGSVFQVAPRVMINLNDLASTELLSPASRATQRLLVAGDEATMTSLEKELKPRLARYEKIQTVEEGRPEITTALSRASRFMGLAAILTVVLSGAAVALAAHSFSRRETSRVAILRSLGATRRYVSIQYTLRLMFLVLVSALVGGLLGGGAQYLLGFLLQDWLQVSLPAPHPAALLTGFGTALVTLAGFALPPVIRLMNTPPMRILRAESEVAPLSAWVSLAAMMTAMMLLLVWQAGEWKLAGTVFAGIALALLVMLGSAWLLARLLRQLSVSRGNGWKMGLVNIGRFPGRSALLIATFGTGFLTLALLGGVRGDLMQAWENSLPEGAPNHFLINIQANELEPLQAFFESRQLDGFQLYPMVRGRLAAINQRPVSTDDYQADRAKRLVNREFNLSASATLPKENEVLEGQWFAPGQTGLSVETGIAKSLGISIGDSLTFDVAGQTFSAEVSNLRKVNWESMQPNFFVLASAGLIDELPMSYITSVYVPDTLLDFTTELVKAFPNVTVLDVKAILVQVQRIIGQASRAVEYVFLFTLLAGIVVLLAAIQTQRLERAQEIALLKTLGARNNQIRSAIASEFLMIGGLAGLLGSGLAILIGWVLASQVFDLSYQLSWKLLALATAAGATLTASVGLIVIRDSLKTQPIALLRKA